MVSASDRRRYDPGVRSRLLGPRVVVPDAGAPAWVPLRVVFVGTVLLLLIALIALAQWSWHESSYGRAARYAEELIREGRGCLLSRDWAHVDPATGLAVVKPANAIYCDRHDGPLVWYAPHPNMPDVDGFIEGWNLRVREHLEAGERVGPTFLDRAGSPEEVRMRFRRDAGDALDLPGREIVAIAGREVRWWDSTVIVREPGSDQWLQPAGGAPDQPMFEDRDAILVTALTADAGRTMWVRVASKAGEDLWYFAIDLETGTTFHVFDASSGSR